MHSVHGRCWVIVRFGYGKSDLVTGLQEQLQLNYRAEKPKLFTGRFNASLEH